MKELKSRLIREYPKFDKNPFEEQFVKKFLDKGNKTIKYVRRDGVVKSPNGKVIDEGELILGKEQMVDKEQFVKIYIGSLMVFNQLSKKAALLYVYVAKMLGKNSTEVYLAPQEMMQLMDCSEPTYYKALGELLEVEMLARHSVSTLRYFVNPSFVYNGPRMAIIARFFLDKNLSGQFSDLTKEDIKEIAEGKKNIDIGPNMLFSDQRELDK